MSLAAANPERVRRERSNILAATSKCRKELMPLLKILDFNKIREKVEKEQDASGSEQMNKMTGKYQIEGVEYLLNLEHAFFMSPYQWARQRNCFWTLRSPETRISLIFKI